MSIATTVPLYQQVLGSSWDELDESVRRLHGEGGVRATGMFQVSQGRSRLLRLLAWMGRLPGAGEAVAMQLVVTPLNDGEEWRRSFAGRPLVSSVWKSADGLLAERMGRVEMRFQLTVVEGGLDYRTRSVALRAGPLRVRLPGWLAPRVVAVEKPTGDRDQTYVAVEVNAPLFGLLIAYRGMVKVEE